MPSRRLHQKSRHGCAQCKTKRVKCDERLPSCNRCLKRGLWCSLQDSHPDGSLPCPYPTKPSNRSSKLPAVPTTELSDLHFGLSSESMVGNLPFEVRAPLGLHLNFLDLELMHHYSTVTSYSFSNLPFRRNTWQIAVPREAQIYDFLMHALLAIAAVQLLHVRPDRCQVYEDAARKHQNLALTTSIHYLHNITPTNCHALFVLSSIVAMLALKFPHPSNRRSMSAPVDEIVDFFRLIRGVKTVLQSASEWLLAGWLSPLLHYDWNPTLVPLPEDLEAAFNDLEARNGDDSKDRNTYPLALRDLKIKFQAHKIMEEEPALVFTWPVLVHESYISALRRHDPMALVILAYYSVLLHSVDAQWWAAGRGSQLVDAISRTLPPEWLPLIQWPLDNVQQGWRCMRDRTPGRDSWRNLWVPEGIIDESGNGNDTVLQQDLYEGRLFRKRVEERADGEGHGKSE